MKKPGPTGWRGVMNQRPSPSDFGLSPLADNVDSITQRQRVRLPRISHGIGGGMRVHDDTEVLRLIPPRPATARPGRRISLTGSRAAFGIYAALLIAFLLISHVHLRFSIHDMNMQQSALQGVERKLQRQSNVLDQQMTGLIDLRGMRNYAVNHMNMVPNEHERNIVELTVSSAVKEKYSERAIAQARKEKQQEERALAQGPTARRFWKLADMAWAFAEARQR